MKGYEVKCEEVETNPTRNRNVSEERRGSSAQDKKKEEQVQASLRKPATESYDKKIVTLDWVDIRQGPGNDYPYVMSFGKVLM